MSQVIIAIILLGLLALAFGALLGYAAEKFKVEGDPIIDQAEALLPQTQCGQCGYPGCRPYAEAIAAGEAEINRCPPGGETTWFGFAEAIRERLGWALREFDVSGEFDYAIINDRLDRAVEFLVDICVAEHHRTHRLKTRLDAIREAFRSALERDTAQ